MNLSKRLQCIANLVPAGSRVADIGTDHGYIPIYLVQHGICPFVIASDIKEGPLKTARDHARREGVSELLRFVLAPGLAGCRAEEVDTILIAGMGGETIVEILSAAPWAREKFLLLQPQSKRPELRQWLAENGYAVTAAKLVYDSGRVYEVWCVQAGKQDVTPMDLLIERKLRETHDPLLWAHLDGVIKRTRKRLQGLERAVNTPTEELEALRRIHGELLRMRKECGHDEGV